ncbi:hypothetical protein FNV43_RR07968 [Rhamnella rubrinervis]|uniref:Uncharacterized protein n=1 Tax=Rhamnella rubrinervis TaxID=2594499 RepID=A0A8K0HFW9_9ROSA|nr:hypothetical protein FNV43_RR07968 [Rhamnella rubrinervis]
MGNCIKVLSNPPQEKIKVAVFNGGVEEFEASTSVKITSGPYIGFGLVHHTQPHAPLPPSRKIEPGEVYHLVPQLRQPSKPLVSAKRVEHESCKRHKVKIVVTREQLEQLLLRSAKKFQSGDIVLRFPESFGFEERSPKWRLLLATIPEVRGF